MKDSISRIIFWRVSATAFAGAFAGLLVLGFWNIFQQRQSELEETEAANAKLRSISNYGASWIAPNLSDAKQLFAAGSTTPEISASLFSQIKSQAEPLGLQINSTADGDAREVDGVRWQSVSINLTGTQGAILAFLAQIESSKPYVFVDRLRLQSAVQIGVTLQQEPILAAELVLSAPTGIIGQGAKP